MTVDEASSTTYEKNSAATSASAITTGEAVLVLGTTSGRPSPPRRSLCNRVAVQRLPLRLQASCRSSKGLPPRQSIGQIPADYSQGSGTIVSGTTAYKATEAALAAYPGGIVDRVVQLSNGEFEVHYIGVNWPHHVFVSQDFTVVGAN